MLTCFLLYCLLTPQSSPDTSRVPNKFIHGGLLCKQTQADVQSAVRKKRGGTPKLETEIRNWIEPLRLLSSLDITSPHFSLFLTFPLHHISPSSSSSSLVLQSHSSSSTSSFSHSSRHHFHLLLRLFPPASPFVPQPKAFPPNLIISVTL